MTVQREELFQSTRRSIASLTGQLPLMRRTCGQWFEAGDDELFIQLEEALSAVARRMREVQIELQAGRWPSLSTVPAEVTDDSYPRGSA